MSENSHTLLSPTLPSPSATPVVVRLAVPLPLPKLLDYLWAGELSPVTGQFVQVDVGRQKGVHGLVMEVVSVDDIGFPLEKLKPAVPLAHGPVLAAPMVAFFRWASRYTLSFPGDPLRALLMGGEVPLPPPPPQRLVSTGAAPARHTPARSAVLHCVLTAAEQGASFFHLNALAEAAGVSVSVVQGLVKEGCLAWAEGLPSPPFNEAAPCLRHPPVLQPAQAAAAAEIAAALHKGAFQPFLLDGLTGSGKTEVYFDAIERLLEEDTSCAKSAPTPAQSLILVPEISLTPQWLDRFKHRFGFAPAVWHSGVGEGKKRATWHAVADGSARVVVGARSALFLPFQHLRLIVVDEEHDGSYKQDDVFRYHGRDMAVALAHLWKAVTVLASATPSLETWHNAQAGRYKHLILPSRYGNAVLPEIHLLDMRHAEKKGEQYLSPALKEAVTACLGRGEQALLFLNRRGNAPLLICRGCGHRFDCPSCDASLIVHGHGLTCHHCGYFELVPETCPKCSKDSLHAFGPGTRKVLKEARDAFPEATVEVADSDAIGTPAAMAEIVRRMESGEINILVGTQMVAKGHHFPKLTVVGVVDSDMGLAHGDLRAAERTFQLITQVAGRAGREANRKGTVYLQTHDPEHPLFAALKAYDRDGFLNTELQARRTWGDPPFQRQIALIVSGENEKAVAHAGRLLAAAAPAAVAGVEGWEVLGPAPAPLAKLRDKYRHRLLVKSAKPAHEAVQAWLAAVPLPSGVRVDVDVDPVSFV